MSRTSAPGVYAAGDCTGVLPLASVAAMQGRIAMWHSLGDAVTPLDLRTVSSNVFTAPRSPPSASPRRTSTAGASRGVVVKLPLATNARAKMQGIRDGFVKLVCSPGLRHRAGRRGRRAASLGADPPRDAGGDAAPDGRRRRARLHGLPVAAPARSRRPPARLHPHD